MLHALNLGDTESILILVSQVVTMATSGLLISLSLPEHPLPWFCRGHMTPGDERPRGR